MHAGVLDLHMYPLATEITQLMLNALPFGGMQNSSTQSTGQATKRLSAALPRVAFFVICTEQAAGYSY